ncbi:MAG: hypothetical protein LBQ81_06355 [Zoogloeaceae bacterium]|nr:hypothetical protein [Zoogloeaceae bacterium]
MAVRDRIKEGLNCPVIQLSDAEKDIASGTGWQIARFENATLVELFDPKTTPFNADARAMTIEAINDAMIWMSSTDGEHWLVLCASDELREPLCITPADASGFEKMARVFGEVLGGN